ncbi:hypothetical protein LRS06_25115 [Hymenobacter sp. J193]|uniref:hypothetical protein n=1 Tax=Hymenobacter sp. J193 TaxID=2898429 RepID=UPI002150DA5A|nr:hypothetical protein [Hymenobacter sp. J193]MCR5891005.1 hypothetical protein [Hymenobacter sp. J193]
MLPARLETLGVEEIGYREPVKSAKDGVVGERGGYHPVDFGWGVIQVVSYQALGRLQGLRQLVQQLLEVGAWVAFHG